MKRKLTHYARHTTARLNDEQSPRLWQANGLVQVYMGVLVDAGVHVR